MPPSWRKYFSTWKKGYDLENNQQSSTPATPGVFELSEDKS